MFYNIFVESRKWLKVRNFAVRRDNIPLCRLYYGKARFCSATKVLLCCEWY